MCGSFLVPFAWWRLVQASLSPLSSPSISQGLCTLVLASQALPLQRGAGVHLIWLSRPALCFSGLYSLILAPDTCPPHRRVCVPLPVLSHWPDLCRGACVFFWLPRDSSQPHGLQPTRLLHPYDFQGKSTGVGCPRLLRELLLETLNS